MASILPEQNINFIKELKFNWWFYLFVKINMFIATKLSWMYLVFIFGFFEEKSLKYNFFMIFQPRNHFSNFFFLTFFSFIFLNFFLVSF